MKPCRTPGCVSPANRPKRNQNLDDKSRSVLLWPAVIVLAVALVDQLTKLWAVASLTGQFSKQIIGETVMFSLTYNEGGAMGTNFGTTGYYTIVALIILPFIGYYLWRNRFDCATSWPLAFILGGAIGNLIDRIRLGRVVDFIDIDIPDIHLSFFQLERWWTFNVADAAITCSIVFLLVHMLFAKKPQAPSL